MVLPLESRNLAEGALFIVPVRSTCDPCCHEILENRPSHVDDRRRPVAASLEGKSDPTDEVKFCGVLMEKKPRVESRWTTVLHCDGDIGVSMRLKRRE